MVPGNWKSRGWGRTLVKEVAFQSFDAYALLCTMTVIMAWCVILARHIAFLF